MTASSTHEATPIDAEMPEVTDKIVPVRRRIDAGHAPPPVDEVAALGSSPQAAVVAIAEGHLPDSAAEGELPQGELPKSDELDAQADRFVLDLEEPSPEMLAAAAGQTALSYREHVQLQVAQLAGHLRERLREVDRREAQLNARVAELEADLRASKLWIRDRELAFQEREGELVAHIADLENRLSDALDNSLAAQTTLEDGQLDARQRQFAEWEQELAAQQRDLERREDDACARDQELVAREHSVSAREDDLARRESQLVARHQDIAAREQQHELLEQDLSARSHDLAERRQQLASEASQLDQQRQALAREVASLREIQHTWDARQAEQDRELAAERQRLARQADEAARREADLQAAEAELARHVREWQRDEAALATDRQAWTEQRTRQRQALEDRQRQVEADLDDRRQRLDARQEWIEQQKAGLEQVRGEVLALHRQSLEMRLLAEQLWAQITGRLTPSEVTHAIAQLKLKLSEQYRLEEQSLEARKRELLALAERIRAQHDELSQLRTGLRDWAAARQAEIEAQAATLVQRELALDEQHEQLRQARTAWHAERWQPAA